MFKNKINNYSDIILESQNFIDLAYRELGKNEEEINLRKHQISTEIYKDGTYFHTYQELEYGCMLAWRNNTHCIGKPHWKSLKVLDYRNVQTEEDIFSAIKHHISYATNQGVIRPVISIFSPKLNEENEIRIWNSQFIRYAGYQQKDGYIIGDPENVEITGEIIKLGWNPKHRGYFDILPIVIQIGRNKPKFFGLPSTIISEVHITHPRNKELGKIGMKWHSLPAITNMFIEIGGIRYTAAPFNGWYTNIEIVQNLANHNRYNFLPQVAKSLNIPIVKEEKELWKDIAFAELSIAVYHSFNKAGVKIVDQYTSSKQFVHFMNVEEKRFNRIVPAKYSWIVPSCASSLLSVYHKRFYPLQLKPYIGYNTIGWNRDKYILPRGEVLETEFGLKSEFKTENEKSYQGFQYILSNFGFSLFQLKKLESVCPFSKYKKNENKNYLTKLGLFIGSTLLIPFIIFKMYTEN